MKFAAISQAESVFNLLVVRALISILTRIMELNLSAKRGGPERHMGGSDSKNDVVASDCVFWKPGWANDLSSTRLCHRKEAER